MTAKATELRSVPISECRLLERNPQYLTPRQMQSLKASIERDGFVSPILLRPLKDGGYEIISGNHRYLAARELGYENVPAVISDMTDKAAKRLAINLNMIHGEPTVEQLAPFLADLDMETLSEIHLDASLKDELLKFDDVLGDRLNSLMDVPGLDRESSKNRPDCKCQKCGRLHQSKST